MEILGKKVAVEEKKGILYLSKDGITIELTGVFREDKTGEVHGKVTQLVCKTEDEGDPIWDIGNMSYDFDQLFIKIGDGKLDKVIAQIFDKKDVIWGSHFDDTLYGFDGNDEVDGWRGHDVLYGGKGKDELIGNIGNDKLNGGPGKDVLKGGPGYDTFVFDQKLTDNNIDTIYKLDLKRDSIELKQDIFTAFAKGDLAKDQFHIGKQATGDEAQILYKASKGHLLYDPDGAGGAKALKFANAPKDKDIGHDLFFVS
jgi:Ca2+-binding RTX toxin-like protein